MHCLAVLDSFVAGDVIVADGSLVAVHAQARGGFRRRRVGFVFQHYTLPPPLSAEENSSLPLAGAGGKVYRAWVHELNSSLSGADRHGDRPAELSGGQQQRVAWAPAVLARPD